MSLSVLPVFPHTVHQAPPWSLPPRRRSRTARLLASDRAATRSVARMEFADGTVYEGEVSASGQMEGRGRVLYTNGNWRAHPPTPEACRDKGFVVLN